MGDNSVEERISSLELTKDVLSDNIKELTTEVKELRSELVTRMGKLESKIQDLERKIITHEESFAKKDKVHNLELIITKIQGDLTLYASKISDIERTYTKEISELKKAQELSNNKLEEVLEAITDIKSQRKAIEEDKKTTLTQTLAVSSAISTIVVVTSFLLQHFIH